MGTSALAGYADIDRKERALQTQLEAAQRGQDQAMLGTGASIGMQFGLPKAIDAFNAATSGGGTILTPSVDLANVSNIGSGGGGSGLASTAPDLANVSNIVSGSGGSGLASTAPDLANVASIGTEAAGIAAPVEGLGGAAEVAGVTTEVTGASTGSGFMAGIQSLATPVAIGLGVAFLLNKLFD